MKRVILILATAVLLSAAVLPAYALSNPATVDGWTGTRFGPYPSTRINGVSAGLQVGVVNGHAALWSGDPNNWTDLNPPEATASEALAISGNHIVGSAGGHAVLWTWDGASAVCTVLPEPSGTTSSSAVGISGDYQAGWAVIAGSCHAILWHGTDAPVDLSPQGASYVQVRGISGDSETGYSVALFGGWSALGSLTGELTYLSPPGEVLGISGNGQTGYDLVGWSDCIGADASAILWHGTTGWASLMPQGADWSSASAICGQYVAGYAWGSGYGGPDWCPAEFMYPGGDHAFVWRGSASDWVDLTVRIDDASAMPDPSLAHGLNSSYRGAHPSSIFESSGEIWVGGSAYGDTGWQDASLWHRPPPNTIKLGAGVPVAMELSSGISLTFDGGVTDAGYTSVRSDTVTEPPPSGDFQVLGTVYNVSSSAKWDGGITITLPYSPPETPISLVHLMHYDKADGQWHDVTRTVDPVEHTVTGQVASLSPFAVASAVPSSCFGGFLQPINMSGSSIFKLGSTVPVKFQLVNPDGSFIFDVTAKILVAKVSNNIAGTEEMEGVSTSAATTGNLFRYDSTANLYVFNLSTKKLSIGTWQIRADLGDGNPANVVWISLR